MVHRRCIDFRNTVFEEIGRSGTRLIWGEQMQLTGMTASNCHQATRTEFTQCTSDNDRLCAQACDQLSQVFIEHLRAFGIV